MIESAVNSISSSSTFSGKEQDTRKGIEIIGSAPRGGGGEQRSSGIQSCRYSPCTASDYNSNELEPTREVHVAAMLGAVKL